MPNEKKYSIVWNPSQDCVWDCAFCCISAKHKKEKLKTTIDNELNFDEKIKIIDQLEVGKFTLDFGGGEFFNDPKNVDLVLYASEKIGAENIGISVTGAFITEDLAKKLKNKVNDIEISLDVEPSEHYSLRPANYHKSAAKALGILKKEGFYVGVQTVITNQNMQPDRLLKLYNWIIEHNIDKWSILRYFPVGRGDKLRNLEPSNQDYCDIVSYLKTLAQENKTNIHFQYLLPGHENYTTSCRAVKKSIGIMPDGTVVACFWALDDGMKSIDDRYILGKLPNENIKDILKGAKADYWRLQEHKCCLFEGQ